MPDPGRSPLPPPPEDAVALYVRWRSAKEHRAELERTLPPAGRTDAGGIAMPIRGSELIEADQAEHEASLAFYRHKWWFNAFSKAEAEQVIEKVARRDMEQ